MDPTIPRHVHVSLKAADTLWSWVVVTPLCVFYWAGTWKLVDHYVLSSDGHASSWVSLGVGSALCTMAYFLLPVIKEYVPASCHLKHVIVSRLIVYSHNFGTLNYWRGIWHLEDHYWGTGLHSSLVCLGLSLAALILLRALSNVIACPFIVILDTDPDFYETWPLFRTPSHRTCRYILDSFISHFVVVTLGIQVWRGFWNIMALYLSKHADVEHYLMALGVGFSLALVLVLLQHPVSLLATKIRRTHHLFELFIEDLFKLFVIVSTLFIWYGGWGLCRDFLMTETWHYWASHGIGSLTLLLLQIGGTVGGLGISLDCEEGQGRGLFFPIDYFLHWYKLSKMTPYATWVGASPDERSRLLNSDMSHDDEENVSHHSNNYGIN